eukprot:COSAG02_NODE_1304_length_13353_cov_92.513883_6_plen_117_part_00
MPAAWTIGQFLPAGPNLDSYHITRESLKTAEEHTQYSAIWPIQPVDDLFEHIARIYEELLAHYSVGITCPEHRVFHCQVARQPVRRQTLVRQAALYLMRRWCIIVLAPSGGSMTSV